MFSGDEISYLYARMPPNAGMHALTNLHNALASNSYIERIRSYKYLFYFVANLSSDVKIIFSFRTIGFRDILIPFSKVIFHGASFNSAVSWRARRRAKRVFHYSYTERTGLQLQSSLVSLLLIW